MAEYASRVSTCYITDVAPQPIGVENCVKAWYNNMVPQLKTGVRLVLMDYSDKVVDATKSLTQVDSIMVFVFYFILTQIISPCGYPLLPQWSMCSMSAQGQLMMTPWPTANKVLLHQLKDSLVTKNLRRKGKGVVSSMCGDIPLHYKANIKCYKWVLTHIVHIFTFQAWRSSEDPVLNHMTDSLLTCLCLI